jgi:predicted NBD/HSP70 family sugar kinase
MTGMAARSPAPATVGDLFTLVRSGGAGTRSEIARCTGLSRTAVAHRVAALIDSGLVAEGAEGPSSGGRPPLTLRFERRSGVVLAAAIGRTRTQLAVTDLAGAVLAEKDLDQEVGAGPEELMPSAVKELGRLVEEAGFAATHVRGAGLSIPGTVDVDLGGSLDSPIMRGWDGIRLAPYFRGIGDVPVYVDNDANAMVLAERRGHLQRFGDALLIKASTGIGAGVVAAGRLVRGGLGAAGEIGHVKVPAAAGRSCRCGDVGCLEAVAGGWALVQELQGRDVGVRHVRELVLLAADGDPQARSLVRESGRRTGEVLGAAVNLLNPEVIVIGGDMASAYDLFAAGVRETLYSSATALATRRLEVVPATHGERSGVVGCAVMVLEEVLSAEAITAVVSRAR